MDINQFGDGFDMDPHRQEGMPDKAPNPARRSIADHSAKWSAFFSRIVTEYLEGSSGRVHQTQREFDHYISEPTARFLDGALRQYEESAFYNKKLTDKVNEMHFHTLNQPMAPNWLHLIHPGDKPPEQHIALVSMQSKLAIQAMRLTKSRYDYSEKQREANQQSPFLPPVENHLDQSFVGRMTEIDAAIALIELAKLRLDRYDERLVPVPAPLRYERYPGKAVDFLLFDTVARQAIGIQVKTRLHPTSNYDKTYVSFIDGVKDLGNYEDTNYDEGQRRYRNIVRPGLIAADLIMNNHDILKHSMLDNSDQFHGFYGQVLHARNVAQTFFPHLSYINRAEHAARKIESHLISALHRN